MLVQSGNLFCLQVLSFLACVPMITGLFSYVVLYCLLWAHHAEIFPVTGVFAQSQVLLAALQRQKSSLCLELGKKQGVMATLTTSAYM